MFYGMRKSESLRSRALKVIDEAAGLLQVTCRCIFSNAKQQQNNNDCMNIHWH